MIWITICDMCSEGKIENWYFWDQDRLCFDDSHQTNRRRSATWNAMLWGPRWASACHKASLVANILDHLSISWSNSKPSLLRGFRDPFSIILKLFFYSSVKHDMTIAKDQPMIDCYFKLCQVFQYKRLSRGTAKYLSDQLLLIQMMQMNAKIDWPQSKLSETLEIGNSMQLTVQYEKKYCK